MDFATAIEASEVFDFHLVRAPNRFLRFRRDWSGRFLHQVTVGTMLAKAEEKSARATQELEFSHEEP